MIFHANIQPSRRCGSGKHLLVFQGASGAVFCTAGLDARVPNQFTGLAFADHAIISGCPRCERSPDRLCWSSASRTIALLTSAPPPPLPPTSSCDDSGADTVSEIPHPG